MKQEKTFGRSVNKKSHKHALVEGAAYVAALRQRKYKDGKGLRAKSVVYDEVMDEKDLKFLRKYITEKD